MEELWGSIHFSVIIMMCFSVWFILSVPLQYSKTLRGQYWYDGAMDKAMFLLGWVFTLTPIAYFFMLIIKHYQ